MLYTALGPAVFTLARRMLASRSLAEDVLHDTFVEAFTKLGELRTDADFAAWARRIAVNRCLTHIRSAWVARRCEWPREEPSAGTPVTEAAVTSMRLEAALDALPDRARAVVWLHDVEGYTHREIGALMGRTSSFSKSQLARAHARLRVLLTDDTSEDPTLCVGELKTC